ncbi:hypothetical protein LTR86_000438 [Recurvomyces mirabilis]|nr:hypothetical protein LTR86_000438 [Recurvomyces mirabilis]
MYLPAHLFQAFALLVLLSLVATASDTSPWHPVITTDFPDPSIIQVDGMWYAFASQSAYNYTGVRVQIAASPDFETWSLLTGRDALAGGPKLAPWVDGTSATSSAVWAPSVFRRGGIGEGVFVLYYSAVKAGTRGRSHCIGTATSSVITGPYTPTSPTTEPWICPLQRGGAIDPAYFHDASSGKAFILYKIDGNSISGPTPIMLQQISPEDGVSKVGEPVQVLTNDAGENLVEAPGMFRMGNVRFVLAYSTGDYADGSYALRYAIAEKVTGPFVKAGGRPWLGTGDMGLVSPVLSSPPSSVHVGVVLMLTYDLFSLL